MRCLCLASYHSLPTVDILCCVLCPVYAYAKLCVGGGGTYAFACIKSSGFYECMCHPPPLLW